MAVFETIRRQVAVAGKVTDRITGKVLPDVSIEILAGPPSFMETLSVLQGVYGDSWASSMKRPDRTLTRADGHFHFMDLPDGVYTLKAVCRKTVARYGSAQADVTVSRAPSGSVNLVSTVIILSPSTVRGKVTRQGSPTPVVMAEIRVSGSLEFTHTDGTGNYILSGLESSAARQREVTVSAVGYQDRVANVLIPAAGDEVVLDIQLVPV